MVNNGIIVSIGTAGSGIDLSSLTSGGSVTNEASGSITSGDFGVLIHGGAGAGSVVNYGGITSTGTGGLGVDLTSGGSVTNAASALITSTYHTVEISGGTGTVINEGTITGTGTASRGIKMHSGGSVTNATSAAITSAGRSAIFIYGSAGTVVNDGSIASAGTGPNSDGIKLLSGTITNAASASITGDHSGVYIYGGAGTVVNDGSIAGSGGTAVLLAASFANLLVADPGAVFNGTVNGGNTIGATAASTLAFASASSAGTLHGLDLQYINFAQITIDAGASWVMTGANTIAAGVTLTELTGATVTDTGTLANYGSIIIDPSTLDAGGLTGTGSVTIATGSTLDVSGTIAGGETIKFAGSGAYLYLGNPSSVAGRVTNFDVGEAILLKGVAAPSVNYAGGTLSFAGGSFALSLAGGGTPNVSAGPNGAEFSVLCFCIGTRILTPSGERQV